MIDIYTENEILNRALEAFKQNVALPMKIDIETAEVHLRPNVEVDRLLRIFIQETELYFYAEIKANIPNITLAGALIYKLRRVQLPHNILLVTRYVTAQLAENLKKENIQFIDAAGNAYINQPPLYIFVKGNKLPEIFRPVPQKRVFKPTGLKIIYAFFCNPGLEKKPYREIAQIADVALGTVGWIMRDLRQMGYLLDMGKRGKRLVERENLLNRWVTAYAEQLKPKLFLGRFKGGPDWRVNRALDVYDAQWGGEAAAAKLTNYIRPQGATIYIATEHLNHFLIDFRLKNNPDGQTEIFKRFWKPAKKQLNGDTVHPLLIYADLLATGNQRNIEAARKIYEQYIFRLIRED